MIRVSVAAQQDLDVGETEPQLLDRGTNHRDRLLVVAVDEDVSLRRRDQEGTQPLRADKVDIPDHLVGRKRLVVVVTIDHLRGQLHGAKAGEQH